MKKILFLFVALCAFVSCDETITEPDGYAGDTIHLSIDKVNPAASGGEYVIATIGEHWWICEAITIDGERYSLIPEGELDETHKSEIEAQYGSFDGSGEPNEIVSFSNEWFTVTKSTSKEIRIKLKPNFTNESRSLTFTPQAGNYFGNITVIQSGATVSNLRFSDVKLKGDQLTLAEAETLTEQIEADAYSGIQFYNDDMIRFFSGEDTEQFVEYKYKNDPKEEDLTTEEAAVCFRIEEWLQPSQIETYFILSNENETTVMFLSLFDIATKSLPSSPIYFHIDVTDRYKGKYPELDIAYVTYRPQ